MNAFPLRGVRRRVEVTGNDRDGFRIRLFVRPAMEDWWADLLHFELFADESKASTFAQAVEAAEELNLDYWWWWPSPTLPFGSLQQAPTCKLSTEAWPRADT